MIPRSLTRRRLNDHIHGIIGLRSLLSCLMQGSCAHIPPARPFAIWRDRDWIEACRSEQKDLSKTVERVIDMAFRLRPRESVADGLRRLATKELRSARRELQRTNPPRDETIHEARKDIKKARAIMDVVEADEGGGLAGCKKRLRQVNRTLSGLRDAGAMFGMATKLRDENPGLFSEHSFARVRRRLSSYKREAMKTAQDEGAWKQIDRQLRKVRRDAKRWRPAHRQFSALAAGIRMTHRLGRSALGRAKRRQRAADFHDWRKHIKALWYQLRLLERSGPDVRKDVRVLHQAETWLGEDHDVVVLCEELSTDTSLCDLARLRAAADRYQCDLRRKAIARTAPIFARTSGQYVRRIKRAWKGWQRRQNGDGKRLVRRQAA
jgi:CHAD domain-containing protein